MDPQRQREFFEAHRATIAGCADADEIVRFIRTFEGVERRVLWLLAHTAITDLDSTTAVATSGIEEMLADAAAATDDETRANRTNLANMISYNLAADLADCWPGDERPRTRLHFETGLRAANDCIRWREELQRGPASLAMAWWARGMHELSLGERLLAADSFEHSFEYAEDDDAQRLADGYAAIALGDEGRYQGAVDAFTAQLPDEDAEFSIAQLETVRSRYA